MILMGIPTRVHHSVCTWNVPADEATFQYRSTYIHWLPICDRTVIQLSKKKMSFKNNHLRNFKRETSFWSVLRISSILASSCLCAVVEWGRSCWKDLCLCAGLHPSRVVFSSLGLPLSLLKLHWCYYGMPLPLLFLQRIPVSYPYLLSSCGGINIHLISH